MRSLKTFNQVYFYSGIVDIRKQIHGLAIMVQETMGYSPLSGSLFVFISRDKRRIRILYWDDTGFALWAKILDRHRYQIPKPSGETLTLTSEQLDLLLKGLDIFKFKPHEKVTAKRYP